MYFYAERSNRKSIGPCDFMLMIRDKLGNMPFKASDQKSTLAGNSRMFARLLCSVLRIIEQDHK